MADATLAQGAFSVDDVTTNEGASGTTTFTFTVTRNATNGAVSVDVATEAVTATAGTDYVTVGTTLNFADTVGSLPVQVTVNGDGTVELDETFNVRLSNPTGGASIADDLGVGTIQNDDAAQFTRGPGFQTTEGNSGTTPANFTVILSAPVDVDVTVDIATEDLVATLADLDYQFASGTLTFPANSPANTSQQFPALVNGDTKVEFNQRFQTRLTNVQSQGRAVTILDALQTTNIANDDAGRIAINDVTVPEGTGAGPTTFTFNVVLLDAAEIPAGQTLSVDAATANGTATTADGDYAAAGPTTRSFVGNLAAGTFQTFTVQVNHDAKVELDETFLVNLTNLVLPGTPPQPAPPAGSGTFNVVISDAQANGGITNDDAATLSITDRVAFETNTGSTPTFGFTATLSAQVDVPVNVDFATSNGTATLADSDYVANSGTLNFTATAPGQTAPISVTVNGDDKVELDETFLVNLSNIQATGRNVTFADALGLGTIVNDETATLTVNDVTLVEGAPPGTTPFNFTVSLDRALGNAMTVDFDAVDDTATVADNDFAVTSGTLNFAGTQNEVVPLSVNVNGDSNAELNETFRVVLGNLQAGGLSVNISDQGLGTINNDDVMDLSLAKSDGGASSFPGGPISYTLTFNNLGAKTARGVVLTDVVPANTTFNPGGSSLGWSCTPNNNPGSTCTLSVGTVVAAGSGSRVFALNVNASPPAPVPPYNITNTASITDETSGAADTNLANNSAMDTTQVLESASTDFFTLSPCRVIDTRNPAGPLAGPALAANVERIFVIAGTCGIPSTAKAVSLNIAVTAPTAPGNVRLYPGGTPEPLVSSINYRAGQTRSNNAIVGVSSSGELAVVAKQGSGTVHFILDVNGYFE